MREVGGKLVGGLGKDLVMGGKIQSDGDLVFGGGYKNLKGGPGNDIVLGGTGSDHIVGGPGNDFLAQVGEEGNEVLAGGVGDDVIAVSNSSTVKDKVTCGAGFDRVIGTSGTILSLGTVASTDRRRASDEIRNLRVTAKQIHRVRKELAERSISERMKVPGLDPRRADLIVSGAVLLDRVMQRLGATDITLCDLALREGLVLDYIQRNRRHIAQAGEYPDVRRRSVIELAERCSYWPEHANQVARLSLSIFDQTRSAHVLTDREREWLEFAALLHDAGTHISYPRHHKHSYYLIKNGDLRGFEPAEAETIALIARSPQIRAKEVAPRFQRAQREKTEGGAYARRDPPGGRNARPQPRAGGDGRRTARPGRRIPRKGPHNRRRRARALGRPSSDSAARTRVGQTHPLERR